ncbi:uncharacterized protein B0I36DRAFT_312796 [Microdochium trichocladiopsis]|uniref:Response regulatory domain-containing protein n=1 Tax=Microdochium trichocladiopsis TaxID=1682393 RepID=A0A9P8YJ92_9PEZI|nr:uncharacterized protein B0I36DRAFT_312796 [Microdochium trichocladiopsis]KAH7041419.1 hypothetical protein B0I36DRAFT_312796 [Microdochium trichocladiopsis]
MDVVRPLIGDARPVPAGGGQQADDDDDLPAASVSWASCFKPPDAIMTPAEAQVAAVCPAPRGTAEDRLLSALRARPPPPPGPQPLKHGSVVTGLYRRDFWVGQPSSSSSPRLAVASAALSSSLASIYASVNARSAGAEVLLPEPARILGVREADFCDRQVLHYAFQATPEEIIESDRDCGDVDDVDGAGAGNESSRLFDTLKAWEKAVDCAASTRGPPEEGIVYLQAEDNVIMQKIFKKLMNLHGQEVDIADDGEKAVDMYMANPARYRCILMDMTLPTIDGIEAARRIRAFEKEQQRKLDPKSPSAVIRPAVIIAMAITTDWHQPVYEPENMCLFDVVVVKTRLTQLLVPLLLGGPDTNLLIQHGELTEAERRAFPRVKRHPGFWRVQRGGVGAGGGGGACARHRAIVEDLRQRVRKMEEARSFPPNTWLDFKNSLEIRVSAVKHAGARE